MILQVALNEVIKHENVKNGHCCLIFLGTTTLVCRF